MSGSLSQHARQTLALFTQARALHTSASPAAIAKSAGVTRSEAVNAMRGAPVSARAAERLFSWNGLDLETVRACQPGAPVIVKKTSGIGKSEPADVCLPRAEDFKHIFAEWFRP
ncbi:hypothetical protein [Roseibium sp.]|uniref:hypothetical protein n=1 Tax=Roseibium sp. TaxID=1936156 RepID=UPI003B52C50F